MKIALAILVVVAALLACGCTSAGTQAQAAIPAAVPDITGTWAGTMNGYDKGIGFNDHAGGTITLVITGQHGRVFAGNISVVEGDAPIFTGELAGVIGRDGRSLTIVEESGYCTGEIIDENTIEFVYRDDAAPFAISIDSFRRVA